MNGAGSNLRYGPLDLISIGSSEDRPAPTEIKVVERHGDRAVVEVVSSTGRAHLDCVRVAGHWRIDLPSYGAAP